MRYPSLTVRRCVNLAFLTVILLAACSAPKTVTVTPSVAEGQSADQPAATYTPSDASYPHPTYTPYPAYTPLPTSSPTHTPAPAVAPTATETATPTEIPTEAPTRQPPQTMPVNIPAVPAALPVELTRIPDTDPGPPFAILVDTIRIQEDGRYKVTGTVRNDGSETYEVVGVHASFLDDEGNGYGPLDVYCPCLFLEPGTECPFSLGMYGRNFVAYHLHPLGRPVEYHQPASLVLSGLNASRDSIGYVRITGTAINENEFGVKDAIIGGELVDASGQIVSVGSTRMLRDIMPGASVAFDLRIKYEPYSRYQVYVQAIRD